MEMVRAHAGSFSRVVRENPGFTIISMTLSLRGRVHPGACFWVGLWGATACTNSPSPIKRRDSVSGFVSLRPDSHDLCSRFLKPPKKTHGTIYPSLSSNGFSMAGEPVRQDMLKVVCYAIASPPCPFIDAYLSATGYAVLCSSAKGLHPQANDAGFMFGNHAGGSGYIVRIRMKEHQRGTHRSL